jgi:hypothetical protein
MTGTHFHGGGCLARLNATHIRFGRGGNATAHRQCGLHPAEPGFTWSSGQHCSVQATARFNGAGVLVVSARPFLVPGHRDSARVKVALNGVTLTQIVATQDFVICLPFPPVARGERLLIEFDTPDCGRPADMGETDGRTLGLALAELVIAPRDDAVACLVSIIADQLGPAECRADAEMARWAASEMLPWALLQPRRAWLAEQLGQRNIAGWCRIYSIAGNRVTAWAKPPQADISGTIAQRDGDYHAFLDDAARLLKPALGTDICVCLADSLHTHFPVPMMTFQKKAHDAALLIPDTEFFQYGHFAGPEYSDPFLYQDKLIRAVFSGSTTGGPVSETTVRTLGLPRIRAAAYFNGSALVDFRLPGIVQCTNPAAEALLRASPFCQRPRLDWAAQYRHRFLISVDGNGAPWSRPYLALRSRSALLMYESPNLMYYFKGLLPHEHYVPIRQDQDVERVVAMELASPGMFHGVAKAGSIFAATYLTLDMRRRYMAMLLVLHAMCIR